MAGTNNFLILEINRAIALSLPYTGTVIDLGCGSSPYKENILGQASTYVGVDWTNSIHGRAGVDVFANLSRPLPFRDDCADVIVSFQTLEHLPEPSLFLAESLRILKPGGSIYMTVPFMWHVHEEPHDYYRYTRYGLLYLFEKAGFKDIAVKENTGFWQTWALKFNYHTSRFARGLYRYLWIPFWWLTQTISPVLDRIDNNPHETASYTVTACKPASGSD